MKRVLVLLSALLTVPSCQGGAKKAMAPKELWVISSPTGQVNGPLRVDVVFSQPMVTDKDIGPEPNPPIEISPPVEGEARWTDDRTLVFVASEELPPATEFTVRVSKRTVALGGHRLGDDHTFAFSTARLVAEIAVPGGLHMATALQPITLTFNQRVDFANVFESCDYKSGGEKRRLRRSGTAAGPATVFNVVPSSALTADTDWTFACSAALRGSEGTLGLASAAEKTFHTHGPLKFTGLDDTQPSPDDDKIVFGFSTPLAEPYRLAITPAVSGFPDRCYSDRDSASLTCSLTFEPQTDYKVSIAGDQTDVFGQTLAATQVATFKTLDAEPGVTVESGYMVAELRRPVIPVWTRNTEALEVRAIRLTPKTFNGARGLIDWWSTEAADLSKQKSLKAVSKTISVGGSKNQWRQHAIDPAAMFGAKRGPGMFYVEIAAPGVQSYPYDDGGKQKVLVNFTDIGVVSKFSAAGGVVWVTRLSSGKALPGARVELYDAKGRVKWSGVSGRNGLAALPPLSRLTGTGGSAAAGDWAEGKTPLRLFVRHRRDFTMVNARKSGGLSAWNFSVSSDTSGAATKLRGFMHSDRGLYRPGETVHIKGLARASRLGSRLAVPARSKVEVEVQGPRAKTFHSTTAKLSSYGGFWFDLELPGDARLGDYTVRATLAEGTFTRRFAVEEYRPATFEVNAQSDAKSVVERGRVRAELEAKYLYGAPMRGSRASVTVHRRPRRVRFASHGDFFFGDQRTDDRYHDRNNYSQELITESVAKLDASGRAVVSFDVGPADMTGDADLVVRTEVSSVAGEVISKSFTLPYYRSKSYVGIKTAGSFLETGKRQTFELVNVSPEGKQTAGNATVKVERRDWNCAWQDWGYRGSYQCDDVRKQVLKRSVAFNASSLTALSFVPKRGGEYWISVENSVDKRVSSRRLYAWGSDGGSWRSDDSPTFDLVMDKREYRAGDKANLILKTDLNDATGLVTIERDGIIERRLIRVTAKNKRLTVPIKAAHAPNVYVSVALVQGRQGKGTRGKPRMKMGMVNLAVRPEGNALRVEVKSDEKDVRPGDDVTATVRVTDAKGRPVAAEVALTAADEGVLSLIGYKTPDPVPTFYAPWGLGVTTATQFSFIRDIPGPGTSRPATGGDSGGPGSVRSRFLSTALWKPGVVTNSAGVAKVSFKAPDNLTAFRLMAVAADRGHRFGSGDSRFTVSKPLQAHRYLPRFLTVGDKLDGGIIVHNETGRAGTATVSIVATNSLATEEPTTKDVAVPIGGRVPVLWRLNARSASVAELRFSVAMNGEKDAVEFALPIHHPSPEAKKLVAAGSTRNTTAIAIELPAAAIPSTATVHVSVDPNGLAGIEEGLRDLIGYPYGCLEQTTSKVIPMIAVRGLAESLNLAGLSQASINRFVTAGIAKIGRHQTAHGGFSLWRGGRPSTYYTAYALYGLHLAKTAGYKVDDTRIADALAYLARPQEAAFGDYGSRSGDLGSQAFALYVRAMLGHNDTAAATQLQAVGARLPVYGTAFLARALAAGLGKKDPTVVKLVTQLAAQADDAVKKGRLIDEPMESELAYYMSDSLRTTAIVLGALVDLDPSSPAIAPLAKAIMKHRRADQHESTQGNLYSLLALNAYANHASGSPTVNVKLDGRSIIKGKLSGKARLRATSASVTSSAKLSIETTATTHYNVEVRFRKKAQLLKSASNGLTLKRSYLNEKGAKQTSFKLGDIVRVRLELSGAKRAAHLMLSDRIPAGFEVLNTRFATTNSASKRQQSRGHWGGTREIHDERVDFSSEYNWSDSVVREYQMRAIAIGSFAVPPTVAELMYEPAKNGRTGLGKIEVKQK